MDNFLEADFKENENSNKNSTDFKSDFHKRLKILCADIYDYWHEDIFWDDYPGTLFDDKSLITWISRLQLYRIADFYKDPKGTQFFDLLGKIYQVFDLYNTQKKKKTAEKMAEDYIWQAIHIVEDKDRYQMRIKSGHKYINESKNDPKAHWGIRSSMAIVTTLYFLGKGVTLGVKETENLIAHLTHKLHAKYEQFALDYEKAQKSEIQDDPSHYSKIKILLIHILVVDYLLETKWFVKGFEPYEEKKIFQIKFNEQHRDFLFSVTETPKAKAHAREFFLVKNKYMMRYFPSKEAGENITKQCQHLPPSLYQAFMREFMRQATKTKGASLSIPALPKNLSKSVQGSDKGQKNQLVQFLTLLREIYDSLQAKLNRSPMAFERVFFNAKDSQMCCTGLGSLFTTILLTVLENSSKTFSKEGLKTALWVEPKNLYIPSGTKWDKMEIYFPGKEKEAHLLAGKFASYLPEGSVEFFKPTEGKAGYGVGLDLCYKNYFNALSKEASAPCDENAASFANMISDILQRMFADLALIYSKELQKPKNAKDTWLTSTGKQAVAAFIGSFDPSYPFLLFRTQQVAGSLLQGLLLVKGALLSSHEEPDLSAQYNDSDEEHKESDTRDTASLNQEEEEEKKEEAPFSTLSFFASPNDFTLSKTALQDIKILNKLKVKQACKLFLNLQGKEEQQKMLFPYLKFELQAYIVIFLRHLERQPKKAGANKNVSVDVLLKLWDKDEKDLIIDTDSEFVIIDENSESFKSAPKEKPVPKEKNTTPAVSMKP